MRFQGTNAPYPLSVMRGKLKLSGLSDKQTCDILHSLVNEFKSTKNLTEYTLLNQVRISLDSFDNSIRENFETLIDYDKLREKSREIPSIAIILEGASATGKSVIAVELVHDLVATRFISTDTVRQVLRSTLSEDDCPELYCHTYQAHLHKQSGPANLHPVVRGYLAQVDIIAPRIRMMTERILNEGAIGVVEGVHILPGQLRQLSTGVIEVLIHPNDEIHKAMFTSKHSAEKLRTVSKDIETRKREYEETRIIQEYMMTLAQNSKVPVIEMNSFEDATQSIYNVIVESIRKLVEGASMQ